MVMYVQDAGFGDLDVGIRRGGCDSGRALRQRPEPASRESILHR